MIYTHLKLLFSPFNLYSSIVRSMILTIGKKHRDNQNLVTEVESLHDEQDSLTQEMSTILDNFPKTSMSKVSKHYSRT